MAQFGMTAIVPGTMESVKERVVQALKAQGFGVLTEIDVRQTLMEKIGKEIEPYLILGACNPALAYEALAVERDIGLLLPCNVVLRRVGNDIEVSIIDPETIFSVLDEKSKEQLAPNAVDAKRRLQAVLAALK